MSHYDCKKCGAAYWQECTCSGGQPMTVDKAKRFHIYSGMNKTDLLAEALEQAGKGDTLAAEVRRLREANESLKRLAASVKCSEFDGMRCEDVDGMNWYDRRDELSDG